MKLYVYLLFLEDEKHPNVLLTNPSTTKLQREVNYSGCKF